MTHRYGGLLGVLVAAAMLCAPASALADHGALDPTWGAGGRVTTAVSAGYDSAEDVAVDSNGRTIVVGARSTGTADPFDTYVARYNRDGTLDTSFDGPSGTGNGIVSLDLSGVNQEDYANAVTYDDSNGKIYVAGTADTDGTSAFDDDMLVAKFDGADGDLDTGFDSDGIKTFSVGSKAGGFDEVLDVLYRPGSNELFVVGDAENSPGGTDTAIAKMDGSGAFATDFDGASTGNGKFTTNASGGTDPDVGFAVVSASNSGIVVAGKSKTGSNEDFALIRYNDGSGALDSGFDGDGVTPGNGIVKTDFGGDDVALDAVEAPGNAVVAVGQTGTGSATQFAMAKYSDTAGTLDAGFDGDGPTPGDGKVVTDIGGGVSADSADNAKAVSLDPDNNLVVAGVSDIDPSPAFNYDMAVARYKSNDGTLDTSFDGDGKATYGAFGVNETGEGVASQAPSNSLHGAIVVTGRRNPGTGGATADTTTIRLVNGFSVNNLGDAHDADFGGTFDGVCQTSSPGQCTLRAAIEEATNDTSTSDAISVGTPGQINMDSLNHPEFTVQGPVSITGNPSGTVIDGNGSISTPNRVMDISGSEVSLFDLTIQHGDLLSGNGAAIRSGADQLTLRRVTVKDNKTRDAFGLGSGIFTGNGSNRLLIEDSTISGNEGLGTSAAGGGIHATGPLTVNRSTISGNKAGVGASGRGGGVLISPDPSTAHVIKNSTISGNQSGTGGAGGVSATHAIAASLEIRNSTIAGNSTTGDAGGLRIALNTWNPKPLMTNTIVANNTGDNTPSTNGDCLVDDEFDSSANNLDTDGSCAAATNSGVTTVTPAALALGPLANNGGNTSTRAIPVTSAALNAGNNSTCESTDQRGISRPQGATCDIGAFEQDDFTAPVTVIGAHPKRVTTKRMARFTFSGEPGSTFRCRWDRKAYRACASPKRFRVGLGRHKFRVFAIDKAGNVDTTPVVFRWKVVP